MVTFTLYVFYYNKKIAHWYFPKEVELMSTQKSTHECLYQLYS